MLDGVARILAVEDWDGRETHERSVARIFACALKNRRRSDASFATEDGLADVPSEADSGLSIRPCFVVAKCRVVAPHPVRTHPQRREERGESRPKAM